MKYLNLDREVINSNCDNVQLINNDVSIEFDNCLNKKFSYVSN